MVVSFPEPKRSPAASSPLLEPLPQDDSEVFARMEAILRKIAATPLHELPHTEARALLVGLPTAEYIRVSSGRQGDRYGPPSQRRDIRRKIERYGLSGPCLEYEDHITATGKVIRTDFVKMRADARAGKFKVLLVGRVDRFARNQMMGWLYIYELIASGVYVYFCDDDTVSGLDLGWKDRITTELVKSEGFISTLRENINKSVEARREDGVFIGRVPFGWRWGRNGPEVNPDQIEIVKRAFAIALGNDKLKLASVAGQLNAEGFRYPDGSLFTKGRLHRMLTHPLAKGAWRVRAAGAVSTAKGVWQILPGKGEEVIPTSQFDLLQDLLADRCRGHRNPERIQTEYVLGRLLRCGESLPTGEICDARFWGRPGSAAQSYTVYQHASGVGCCSRDIQATYWFTELAGVAQLQALFAQARLPDSAVEVIARYLAERDTKLGLPDRDRLLAAYAQQIKLINYGFRHGAYGDDPVEAERVWQQERRTLQAQIDAVPPAPELPTESDRAKVLSLLELWAGSTNAEKRHLATTVFQKIYVTREGGPHLTQEGKVRKHGRAGIVRIVPAPRTRAPPGSGI